MRYDPLRSVGSRASSRSRSRNCRDLFSDGDESLCLSNRAPCQKGLGNARSQCDALGLDRIQEIHSPISFWLFRRAAKGPGLNQDIGVQKHGVGI